MAGRPSPAWTVVVAGQAIFPSNHNLYSGFKFSSALVITPFFHQTTTDRLLKHVLPVLALREDIKQKNLNSSMVRFKATKHKKTHRGEPNFNSSMVRFKVPILLELIKKYFLLSSSQLYHRIPDPNCPQQ